MMERVFVSVAASSTLRLDPGRRSRLPALEVPFSHSARVVCIACGAVCSVCVLSIVETLAAHPSESGSPALTSQPPPSRPAAPSLPAAHNAHTVHTAIRQTSPAASCPRTHVPSPQLPPPTRCTLRPTQNDAPIWCQSNIARHGAHGAHCARAQRCCVVEMCHEFDPRAHIFISVPGEGSRKGSTARDTTGPAVPLRKPAPPLRFQRAERLVAKDAIEALEEIEQQKVTSPGVWNTGGYSGPSCHTSTATREHEDSVQGPDATHGKPLPIRFAARAAAWPPAYLALLPTCFSIHQMKDNPPYLVPACTPQSSPRPRGRSTGPAGAQPC